MHKNTFQRLIAIIILISPWLYIHSVYASVLYVILAVLLFISTLDYRKKKKVETTTDNNKSSISIPEFPTDK